MEGGLLFEILELNTVGLIQNISLHMFGKMATTSSYWWGEMVTIAIVAKGHCAPPV